MPPHMHGNEDAHYIKGYNVLKTTLKEKDLGLTISADMKVSEQCGISRSRKRALEDNFQFHKEQ